MDDFLSTLQADLARDAQRIKMLHSALDTVSFARDHLTALGFAPVVVDQAGLLVLRFDPDAPRDVEPAQDVPVDAAPVPVPEARPEPKPEPAPKSEPEPLVATDAGDLVDLRTGPFGADERAVILDMAVDGADARDIARSLNRAPGPVAMVRRQMSDQIDAARANRERLSAPETILGSAPSPTCAVPCKVAPIPVENLSAAERAIQPHLNALGYVDDWTPKRDMQMSDCLMRGDGAGGAAAALGVSKQDVIDRWAVVNTARGDLDHQRRLHRVLCLRAGGK